MAEKFEKTKGFSLVEIIVVIAIISIFIGAAIMNFGQARSQALLEDGRASIINALELVRNRAASGVGSTSTKHGVRIQSTTTVILFEGDSYPGIGPTTTITLPQSTYIDPPHGFDIVFDRISGQSSTGTTTIVIRNNNGTTSVIVTGSGLIYEQ